MLLCAGGSWLATLWLLRLLLLLLPLLLLLLLWLLLLLLLRLLRVLLWLAPGVKPDSDDWPEPTSGVASVASADKL